MAEEIDIRELESTWRDGVGDTISAFAVNVVKANSDAQKAYAAYMTDMGQADNVSMTYKTDDIDIKADIPLIAAVDRKAFGVDIATLDMNLDVQQHVTDQTKANASNETNANASFKGVLGIGPSGSVSTKVTAGVSTDKKRETDYRPSYKIHVEMKPREAPECLSLIVGAMN